VSVIKPQKSFVQVIVQRKGIPNSVWSRLANLHSPDPESHVPGIGQVVPEAVIFQKTLKRIISHEVYPLGEYIAKYHGMQVPIAPYPDNQLNLHILSGCGSASDAPIVSSQHFKAGTRSTAPPDAMHDGLVSAFDAAGG